MYYAFVCSPLMHITQMPLKASTAWGNVKDQFDKILNLNPFEFANRIPF